MEKEITFRKANHADIPLLLHWDQQPHVIACDPDTDWDWNKELKHDPEWREMLIAEQGHDPIGMVQIIDPELESSHYWGKVGPGKRAIDIWIGEGKDLNKGFGTQMMKLAIDRCFSHPHVNEILIDPLKTNTKAHRFYRRLGFRFIEERDFDGDICYVYHILRNNR